MSITLVKDVMTRLVVTFRPEDRVEEAARRLGANRITGGPVTVRGTLLGIVSESDLRASPPGALVNQVMTTKVISVGPDVSVEQAAALMDRFGVRRLPVVEPDGQVIGVIARADLIRAMARPLVTEGPIR